MRKRAEGFTLVEVIVVIAVLAILAVAAIPAYSGYVSRAREAGVLTELDALALGIQAANVGYGEILEIEVAQDYCSIIISVTDDAYTDEFTEQLALLTELDIHTVDGEDKIVLAEPLLNPEGTAYAGGAVWSRENGWKPK